MSVDILRKTREILRGLTSAQDDGGFGVLRELAALLAWTAGLGVLVGELCSAGRMSVHAYVGLGGNSLRRWACTEGQQVLRLRSWIASRSSYCAQDDNFVFREGL